MRIPSTAPRSPPNDRLVSIETSKLRPGVVIRQPICSEDGILLLSAGLQITAVVIQRLIQRGITAVLVHPSELDWVSGHGSNRQSAAPGTESRSTDRQPFPIPASRRTENYDEKLQDSVETTRCSAVNDVAAIYRDCDFVRTDDLRVLEDLVAASLAHLIQDADVFVCSDLLRKGTEYPAQQGVQAAALAQAIGARLGLNWGQLAALGLGCMIHDLGMLRMKVHSLAAADPGDPTARLELMKHPTITFDLMSQVARQAGAARLVAYQIHERADGSGYPRGREGNQIHPLARIAAVADTFIRLISPFSSNPLQPYDALMQILQATRAGQFDQQAVRGLLHAVSLFPIGTSVQLSDGRIARVLRSNGEAYTRPVVQVQPAGDDSEIVDLIGRHELQIERIVTTAL